MAPSRIRLACIQGGDGRMVSAPIGEIPETRICSADRGDCPLGCASPFADREKLSCKTVKLEVSPLPGKVRMYRRKHLRALAETYKPVKPRTRRGVKSRYGLAHYK